MLSFLMPAWAFLKGLPWQVYVAAGLLALLPISYCKGKSAGRAEIMTELREAEAEAQKKAQEARQSADAKAQERAEEFEAEQETLQELIDEAEGTDSNPLDAIFAGGL